MDAQTYDLLPSPQVSHDYPYGSLRCTITFSMELHPKRGYRYVTQTVNPKNGRVNAPKRSTYAVGYMCLHREPETGHVKPLRFDANGFDEIERFIAFLNTHAVTFTAAESAYLWKHVISHVLLSARCTVFRDDATKEQIRAALCLDAMIAAHKAGADFNAIRGMGFSEAAIRALDSGKNPWTVTVTSEPIRVT